VSVAERTAGQAADAIRGSRETVRPLTWLAGLVIVVVTAVMQLPVPVNHDAAWILLGAQRLLDGAAFGEQVVDVNPPLAWWISAIPVALAGATGLPIGPVFKCFIIALSLGSVALGFSLMRKLNIGAESRHLLCVLLLAVLLIAPGYDFGQREHIMVILALPWVWMAAARVSGVQVPPSQAGAIAVLAACGICLKPFFVLIPIAVEVAVLALTRRPALLWRIENLVMVAFGLGYIAAVWLFAPAYFTAIGPAVMANYVAYNTSLDRVLIKSLVMLGLPLLAVSAIFLTTWRSGIPRPVVAGLAATFGALLAAVVQMKGWMYHLYPAAAFMAIPLAFIVSMPAGTGRSGSTRLPVVLCALGLAFVIVRPAVLFVADMQDDTGTRARVEAMARAVQGPDGNGYKVFAFNSSPRDVMPAVLLANARWSSVACCFHFIPALVQDNHGLSGLTADEMALRKANALAQIEGIAADLARERPEVILVDDDRYKLGFHGLKFDWLSFADGHAGLGSQLRHYERGGRIGDFIVLRRKIKASLNLKPSLN
jgi:hypothetical protein